MQDRYAFDAGDFVKLGLLRALIAGTGLRLGINWYLVPDEAHNADGQARGLPPVGSPPIRRPGGLRSDLDGALLTADITQRSVATLEASGALPRGSLTYDERLRPSMTEDARRTWHADAFRGLADADVIFVDPDNGLTTKPRGSRSHKYVFPTELADYSARGQSLVVYHHADRTPGGVATQIPRRLDELSEAAGVRAYGAVVTRLGSVRFSSLLLLHRIGG